MKKTIHSLFFALFLLGTFAFTKSDEWYKFESKDFSFTAEYPGKPTKKVKILNTAEGDLNLNMFEFIASKTETEPVMVYMVSYVEYPVASINSDDKEKLKQFYKKWTDNVVARVNGKLMKETIITLEGFEGVEDRIEMRDGAEFVKMRAFMINNKLYMIEACTETKNEFNKTINRFMNSFKLIK